MSNEIIAEEYKLYFHSRKKYLRDMLISANDFKIWKFQKSLRLSEYYKTKGNLWLHLIWRHIKNRRGLKLGFDIPEGCFAPGLRIYHVSPVVVNPNAKIGRNAIVVGNLCIGNVHGGNIAPLIGNNCMFGWGCSVIGNIKLEDYTQIAAGAVVNKSVFVKNETLIGTPAHPIKK